jgi:UDP-2,3-diacylglucosamine hydrolase
MSVDLHPPPMDNPSPVNALGLIAGEGQFPFLISRGAARQGIQVFAVGFKGHTDENLAQEVEEFRLLKLGQLDKLIGFFLSREVHRVVLAGAIHKPSALQLRPDLRAMRLVLRLSSRNDSSLLRGLALELEGEGMRIVSPLEYVPDLVMPKGLLTRRKPTAREREDIDFGWGLAKELGRLDVGQCIVVHEKVIVAVEAIEGTDEMLRRAGKLLKKPGGVVVKIFKPGQDLHIDQPSVGLQTIEVMHGAGLSCLAVEAGRSLFFDRRESLALADRSGICVVGVEPEENDRSYSS